MNYVGLMVGLDDLRGLC